MATTKKTTGTSMVELKNHLMVSPLEIVVDEKLNPRQEYGEVEELMNSIIENGLRNPIKVFRKDGKLHLREGFRRMRAVNLAIKSGKKIERVPVLIDERTLTNEERTLEFLINNDGKPFTMLEQADVVGQLIKFGWKTTEVVKRTGKARGYIENLIMLTRLPKVIENYIREGKISAHAVIQILREVKQDEAKLIEAVEEAIKAAAASGKSKATPKHLAKSNEEKEPSHGKFFKFCSVITDALADRKDIDAEKLSILEKLLIRYENGQPAKQVAEEMFIDKAKKAAIAKQKPAKTTPPKDKKAAKKEAVKKAPAKKKVTKK
ncbi:MAG: ParB/RepB/Spo0J family partition protein [Bacteroidia bacterium]|nr:ParB/RepB/Spo0J family partition protein [Bacteroidia bacterium]